MSVEVSHPEGPAVPPEMAGGEDDLLLRDAIVDALRSVYDPEIPVNIYDLGLIYRLDVSADRDVTVEMTLTTPNCPVAETMPEQVMGAVEAVAGVRGCQVELVWEPKWDTSRMSETARMALDIY